MFLRAKKYNMKDATAMFEKFYLGRKTFSQFIPEDEPKFEFFQEVLRQGFCYPLYGRDSDGCRVVIVQSRKLDMDKFVIIDGLKVVIFGLIAIMEDEESQIAGVKFILDHQNITSKHIMMPKDVIDLGKMMRTVFPGRNRSIISVHLPRIAHYLLEIFRGLLTEKLRKRLFFYRDWMEVKDSGTVDVKMLPSELGGIKSESELVQDFVDELKFKWNILMETYRKAELDYSKISRQKNKALKFNDSTGSFGILDID